MDLLHLDPTNPDGAAVVGSTTADTAADGISMGRSGRKPEPVWTMVTPVIYGLLVRLADGLLKLQIVRMVFRKEERRI